MSTTNKRICVIGAGCTGLAAMKCCLDEGLEVVGFERSPDIGGLWRYTETPIEGQGCVMRSTTINASKEMMALSDYPPPTNFATYMPHYQVGNTAFWVRKGRGGERRGEGEREG